ncbi:MAG: hypothetical protein QF893_22680 [Alphaproteobacteria bacterium]|jgi:hypothetical protein|nr:hypothetical protein [Alphaproteobacteria bacterium]
MDKGFASLTAALVPRSIEPTPSLEPPPADHQVDEPSAARLAPRLMTPDRQNLAHSADLTGDLISAGRDAYRAERQRLAEKAMALSPDGTAVPRTSTVLPLTSVRAGLMHRVPMMRDVSGAGQPLMVVPAVEPAAEPAPLRVRRRAVTLRLRPDEHVQLLAVRRRLGCSFQVLVVRALIDCLDRLDRSESESADAGTATVEVLRPDARAAVLAASSSKSGVQLPTDLHFFTLPTGWCVAAWRQERGETTSTPSEVLGQVLREQGVADLISADDQSAIKAQMESVSLGEQGNRLALTIRLEPDLHERLLAARTRLGRTGQDILMGSIAAYLAD